MAKIEFNNYDLVIGKTKEGDEVVQLKAGFDTDFIASMREMGVKERVIKQDEEEE